METWLNIGEVARLTGESERTLRRRASLGDIRSRESEAVDANGKRPREYAVSSLPAAAQKQWFEELLGMARKPNVPNQTAIIPVGQRDLVSKRFEAIRLLIEWRGGHRPENVPANIENETQLARHLAQQNNCSERKIWRLLDRWENKHFAGLARGAREDRGKSRFFNRYPLAAQYVLAKFAERLSIQLIFDSLVREWPRIYPGEAKLPSYSTVRSYLEKLPQSERDFIRLSKQQYEARNAPFVRTDIPSVPVNGIWVCDHRIFDVLVVNDCYPEHPLRSATRLIHTAIIDMRTRVIVGSVIGTTGSSRSIVAALKQGAAIYGLPSVFYCDNGKDFRKVGVGADCTPDLDEEGRIFLDPGASSVLAGLGIQVKYCIPRHPQSKMIESFFSTVSKKFDRLWGDAYAGSKPSLRPDECRDAEKQHQKWLLGKRGSSPLPLASDFAEYAQQWVHEYNLTHSHRGLGMNRQTPMAVMDELLPAEQRSPMDVEKLKEFFWETKRLKVSNSTVKFFDNVYEGADEWNRHAMFRANGEQLTVKYDPYDLSQATAFGENGLPLASLVCQTLVSRGYTEDIVKAKLRERSGYRKSARKAWNVLTNGVPSEIDFMKDRARRAPSSFPKPAKRIAAHEVPRLAAVNESRHDDLRIDRTEIGRYYAEDED